VQRVVQIIGKKEVFKRFIFRIEEVRLRHELRDGTLSDEMTRLVFDRGDSVAALVHDTESDCVLFTEQFRYPTYEKGTGWILEIPAGVLESNEDPQECTRREVLEEIGYTASALTPIARVFVSPGGTSERIHIFYAAVTRKDKSSEGGGVASEGEDVGLISVPVASALQMVDQGEIVDAKTILALQWLKITQLAAESRQRRG